MRIIKKLTRMNRYIFICLFCHKPFVCFNSRRKFCLLTNCKDCFWNKVNKEIRLRNKQLVKIAERNHTILDVLYTNGLLKVSSDQLKARGFKLVAFSEHDPSQEQANLHYGDVYEYAVYGLKHLGNREFQIIKLPKK